MADSNITTDEELQAVKHELEQMRANFCALLKDTNEIAQGIEALAIVIKNDPCPAEGLAGILVQHAFSTCDYYDRIATS